MTIKTILINWVSRYIKSEKATAAIEATFIFPIMLVLFFGTLDVGRMIMTNQKTIKASQIAADLITRENNLTEAGLAEAIQAASLALQPYPRDQVRFDIVSVYFDDAGDASIIWRETSSGITPADNVLQRVQALSDPGTGVVMVITYYTYEPIVAGFVMDDVSMAETAFARGRKSDVICIDSEPCPI